MIRNRFDALFREAVMDVGCDDIDLLRQTIERVVEKLIEDVFQRHRRDGLIAPKKLHRRETRLRKATAELLRSRIAKCKEFQRTS